MTGLRAAELQALATSILAPVHAKRLTQLLRLNRHRKLTDAWQAELDTLLEASDCLAVMAAM